MNLKKLVAIFIGRCGHNTFLSLKKKTNLTKIKRSTHEACMRHHPCQNLYQSDLGKHDITFH